MRARRSALGALALVGAIAGPSLAQGPAASMPTASGIPAAASPAATPEEHTGWVLHQGSDPAFSILLPPAWVVADAPKVLLEASLPPDGALQIAVASLPTEATFRDQVLAQEADAEHQTGQAVQTTMRQVGTGLVARLELPPDQRSSHHTPTQVRYLYPACTDHALTLTIAATLAPDDTVTRAGWDDIAANVNPCAAGPAPGLVPDPVAELLGGQYLAVAAQYNDRLASTYAALADGASLRQWKRRMATMATLEGGLAGDIARLAWTPRLQPLADALVAADGQLADTYQRMADVKTVKAVRALLDDQSRQSTVAQDAADALRLGLGLTTTPR